MTDFVHLHSHSTFSILDAWGQPSQIVERVVEAGLSAHALTDHDSTSGHWKFQTAAKEAGIKPLYGIEIRVMDNLSQRTSKDAEGRRFYPYHLGLIARNQEGYKNLMKLTTLAWRQGIGGRGKYMPAVTWDDIAEHQKGLIGTSGCLSGKISRAILGQIEDDWKDVAAQITDCFEPDSLFFEWQNIGMDAVVAAARKLSKLPNSVVTHDVHFTTPDKREAQNIMAALMRWKKVVGPDGQGPMHEDCYLTSAKEVLSINKRIGAIDPKFLRRSMDNTLAVAELCNVELPTVPMVRYPHEGDKLQLFKDMLNEGFKKRGLSNLPKPERQVYIDRTRYEFDIIRQKDFIDYFLIIADICKFCVREDIMKGPARGSSAGSLLAWLLEITEVDPIRHNLVFERFIDLNREDLPDIDMDFPAEARERIHDYLRDKYGTKNVLVIGTFTSFKAKNALDDVARVHDIPYWVPNKMKPYIPERAHGDVRSDLTLVDAIATYPEVKAMVEQFPDMGKAILLEGQYKAMGIHPAGIVVSSSPVEEVAPIYEMPKGKVIGLDGGDVGLVGLVKIDVLGLDGMSIIQRARDAIRKNHGVDIDFYNLPLDDKETLRGFTEVDMLGIFQFSGKATKNILRQIKPTNFNELVDINTLSRPGSLLAGTTNKYVEVHNGLTPPEPIHPIVDRITADTHNLVLYQEQVLKIMREFGGLSWAEASEVRKFLSKRMGVEILQTFREQFVNGAARQGIDEATATKVWMSTSSFGAYGFNRSHSLSYSMLSYWQMYVKRYYPQEFYYAVLASSNDAGKRDLFINEAKRKGVQFLPIDPNKSSKTFSLEPEGIRYGLTQVRGIGDKTADMIIAARPIKGEADLLAIRGIGQKTMELFRGAKYAGDDLFGLEELNASLRAMRERTGAMSVGDLVSVADKGLRSPGEQLVAGRVISRNYRQQKALSKQMSSSAEGDVDDSVVMYIMDEAGESYPVFVGSKLAARKAKEIWEAEATDIYLIRGTIPQHGKFMYANGIVNTSQQDRRRDNGRVTTGSPKQSQLTL